ncbi:MAG: DUF1559 domain-containing protein [Planctomycetaceae bacterium]
MYPFNPEPNLWACGAIEWSAPLMLLVAVISWRVRSKDDDREETAFALFVIAVLSAVWFLCMTDVSRPRGRVQEGYWTIPGYWMLCMFGTVMVTMLRHERIGVTQLLFALLGIAVLSPFTLALSANSQPHGAKLNQCKNNLKQIGLALHNYHDSYESLPAQLEGDPPVSWRVAVLPYLDHAPLYNEYVRSLEWNSGANVAVAMTEVRELTCPSVPPELRQGEYPYTAYAVPYGSGTSWASHRHFRFDEIKDGTSNTIAVVEACGQQIPWAEPRDVPLLETPIGFNLPGSRPHRSEGLLSSYHPGGGSQVLFGDGRVQHLSPEVDSDILKALLTPNGGEAVPEF